MADAWQYSGYVYGFFNMETGSLRPMANATRKLVIFLQDSYFMLIVFWTSKAFGMYLILKKWSRRKLHCVNIEFFIESTNLTFVSFFLKRGGNWCALKEKTNQAKTRSADVKNKYFFILKQQILHRHVW